jgi:predicted nucleotidyltransferase
MCPKFGGVCVTLEAEPCLKDEEKVIMKVRRKKMVTAQEPIRLKNASGEIGCLRKKALEAFLEKLQKQEGKNLLRVVLFGSVARGDSESDSDIDVFVLVENGTRAELRERIVDLAMDINLEEGESKIYISPLISTLEKDGYDRTIGLPVYYNLDEEGIVLYDIAG